MLKKSILLGTSAVLTLALAAPAMAQAADEDIIYTTATKRQTTLQDTPVAVAVTSAATIERANIDDIIDLQSVVPSLRVTTLQSSQNTNFVIRGFGNGANNAGIEPSVGVFVDGVYRSRSAGSIGDLPKLQSVEVLNGPQSTLFGKNASAGVISVNTAAPQFETSGFFEGGIGNFNAVNASGYVTGAVGSSDNVAYSLGGGFSTRDGYVDQINSELDDVNDRKRFNLRGQLLMEPTDNVSVRLIADYSKLDENCCHVTNLVDSPVSGAIGAIDGDFTDRDLANPRDPFAFVAYQNKDSENELDDGGISAHVDVNFANFDLTSITAYRANKSYYNTDADYSLNRSLDVGSDQSLSTFTQELRLTSTTDTALDWMVGGFLFNENVNQVGGLEYGPDLRDYIDLLAGGAATLGGIQGLYPGSAPFFGDQIETVETFTQDNLAFSVFGSADYHVNDRLTLSGGLNFTLDDKDVTGRTQNNDSFSAIDFATTPTVFGISFVDFQALTAAQLAPTQANLTFLQSLNGGANYAAIVGAVNNAISGLRGLQFQPQFLAFGNDVESGNTKDDKVTYLVRAAYEVNPDLNVYASYATGFKSSSWNLSRDSRPFESDRTALENNNLTQPNQNYGTRFADPEFAKVFEVGLKTKFENGYVNIVAFNQIVEDFQTNAFVGTAFVLTNAGETTVNGIEFDTGYQITDALGIKVAATLLDPEFTDYKSAPGPIPGVAVDLTGTKPDNISDLSLSFAATYEHEFANGMTGYIRGDFQHESGATIATNLSPAALETRFLALNPGTTSADFDAAHFLAAGYEEREENMLNLSAGVDFGAGRSAQVWVRNATDDQFIRTLFPGVAQEGIVNGYPNQPRTYGLILRQDF